LSWLADASERFLRHGAWVTLDSLPFFDRGGPKGHKPEDPDDKPQDGDGPQEVLHYPARARRWPLRRGGGGLESMLAVHGASLSMASVEWLAQELPV
jgi:hypothetical protein